MSETVRAVRLETETANARGEVAVTPPPVLEIELRPSPLPPELGGAPEPPPPRPSLLSRWGLFAATVVAPTLIGVIYLFGIAAPRYVSSASFIVRETAARSEDALTALLQKTGASLAVDETHAVSAYLGSRDLVSTLAAEDGLRAALARPQADFLFRFPTFWLPDDSETLYRRFQWMADVEVDPTDEIATLEVNAFTAEDAQALAKSMLRHAEWLLNALNERAYRDAAASADHVFAEAQARLDAAEAELQRYRNGAGSLDPAAESQARLTLVTSLSTELARVQAQIAQQAAQAPSSPSLGPLREQARALRDEIEKRRLEIAGAATSSASRLETYERLTLMRDLAARSLGVAAHDRDLARQEAGRQHLYIQLITQPSLSPDYARYPRAGLDLAGLFALCLTVFVTLRKFRDLAAEHRA